ncbi:MAG: M20/M25/M40 family metallo-hydrolase [Chloroflexota bacterium]|nr:M20/M25/M40 family metallo-hydrolase [Chloroflexota bacterium]
MDPDRLSFLRRLLDAPGPSGYEAAPADIWRTEATKFAAEVTRDVTGNSYARVGTLDGPTVVIAGHIDEIGFVITHVDPEGFLWFAPIGGWDDQVVVGQRLRIAGRNGDVVGVVGKKAAHLLEKADRDQPTRLRDMWLDIGASGRDDAERQVEVGDPTVIDSSFVQLTDDRCVARSMDNRVGAFVALEAARLLAEDSPRANVYAIATAQEETSFAGAFTAAFQRTAHVSIAVDVTHATDYPGADKKANGEVAIGGGPVLSRGASVTPAVYAGLAAAARSANVAYQVQANSRTSGTDADAMIRTGPGTATGIVSIPNRYMHSPNELVSLGDLERAAQLIAAFVRSIDVESDFRP